jgi:surface antigen
MSNTRFYWFSVQMIVTLAATCGCQTESTLDEDDIVDITEGVDSVEQSLPWNTQIGELNGIPAYSNRSTGYFSNDYSEYGMKWQCVEYVNRYYALVLGHQNLKGKGHAKTYYSTAADKGLVAYPNGGSTRPAINDMLVSTGGRHGHVAIIREVGDDYVDVIHQNWANDSSDNSKRLKMTVSNDSYTVSDFSDKYPVRGWLRKPQACTPKVSEITPLTASRGELTTFTVNGSCLPSTLATWIGECVDPKVTGVTPEQAKFTCTPSFTDGEKRGVIKTEPDGTVLKDFAIKVQ